MTGPDGEKCTWCGAEVEPSGGFRAYEPAGERGATFCRLEHIVPWQMQGGVWLSEPVANPGITGRGTEEMPGIDSCSHCAAALDQDSVLLVRHRGEHRIGDGFCSVGHMAAWAKAGGRWR